MTRCRSLLFVATCSLMFAASTAAQVTPADTLATAANALMQSKQYAAAARLYDQLVQAHPGQAAYLVRLGVAQQLAGNLNAALDAYRASIRIGAGNVAQYNLGTVFALQGRPDSAFHWLQASIAAGFSSLQTLTTDTDLTTLHGDARWQELVDAVTRAATPCMYRPESRAFDFWVGEWNVTTPAGQPVGTSSVQLLLGGCALFENWSAGGGGDGKSLNSYNPELGMWHQFWTDQTGRVTEYRTSKWIDGSLQYTAERHTPRPLTIHMTFTPVNKDLVRQLGEVSTDGGKTWTVQFDLYYHRRP
jgi:hypothetical protein